MIDWWVFTAGSRRVTISQQCSKPNGFKGFGLHNGPVLATKGYLMSGSFRHVSMREDGGVLILTIELQRISSYELSEAMGRELIEAVKDRESPKVVVDLGKVEYMSSV